jgi:hypothetical protein
MTGSNNPNPPVLPELSMTSPIFLSEAEKELIQNVHRGYQKIIVQKEFNGGFSNTRVFLVLPVKPNGSSDAGIVTKTGPAEDLWREKENYEQYMARALPFTATQIRGYYEPGDHTVDGGQAALNYVFAGGVALGETLSLEDYYHTQTADVINKTLDALLDKALGEAWYGQPQPLNSLFQDEYGRHLPKHTALQQIVEATFPKRLPADGNRIKILGVTGSYLDPLKAYPILLDKPLKGRRSFVHGDLHVRNVLVDSSGKAWLIDFAKVRERHNLFDFIKLETYIRLMALAQVHGAFSWNEYIQFEQELNAATFDQASTPPANPELAKAYQVIRTIRQVARKYMGHTPDFQNEYFPALFLYALSMLKYFPINGPIPTQLMFMTTCVLGHFIFDEREAMKPISRESKNSSSKKPSSDMPKGHAGGISIGGEASNNIIVSGNQNNISHTSRNIDTGGGAYVGGNVNIQNGDFVGRDKHITQSTGASVDEIARAFVMIREKANQEKDGSKKEDALQAVEKLKIEAERGEQAEESRVQRWFTFLADVSTDAWDVAVATLSNPKLGLGTAFKKIVQRAKEEKAQRDRK